ncbi:MAG: hypothetical protein R3284_04610 [Rubricoccaceae bacterium]|nr:hypothetical protein [Rubricoccaceae bacterium]
MQLNNGAAGIPIYWEDGAKDAQEAFDFEIVVIRVDVAGNESEPSSITRIADPGRAGEPYAGLRLDWEPGEPSN